MKINSLESAQRVAKRFALLSLIFFMSVCRVALATTSMPPSLIAMKDDLTQKLHCRWHESVSAAVCEIKGLRGSIGLISTDQGKTVETVEIDALLAGFPKKQFREEQVSQWVILNVVNYLFPDWKASSTWTENALIEVSMGAGRYVKKIGEYTLLIQAHQFVDLDGYFAEIVISKNTSTIADAE